MIDHLRKRSILLPASVTLEKIGLAARARARKRAYENLVGGLEHETIAVHSKARQRYEDLLRAIEEARSRAVEILEELGTVVLDDSIPDSELRTAIFARLPSDDIGKLVDGCRALRAGNEGSHLGLVHHRMGEGLPLVAFTSGRNL
jgi:hypothetical protein